MTSTSSPYLMNTYAPEPISFIRGEGVWLWDDKGKKYLDTSGGIAVMALGHSHPGVINVLKYQAEQLMHVSNGSVIPQQVEFARALAKASGMEKSFFCNCGAEATETSLKIARRFAHHKGYKNPKVITMKGAFHGRTFNTLSAASNPVQVALFNPMVPGFIQCEFDNVDALKKLLETEQEVVGVMFEPVQGEGGVKPHSPGFMKEARKLCDQYDVLMILDEVQTGFGRTGKLYAYQHEGILPDVVASAKALGNGFPIGVCMARGFAANLFDVGSHGSTYGGNPLACAVGHKVLDIMCQPDFHKNTQRMAEYLLERLKDKLSEYEVVKDIRGKGMMIGVELSKPCAVLKGKALELGMVINVTQGCVIRLTPPLIISKDECDVIVESLVRLIKDFNAS